MQTAWPFLSLLLLGAAPRETLFVQVAPVAHESLLQSERTPNRDRAVVLIHGLRLHPLDIGKVGHAMLQGWQTPDCLLVKHLSRESDVYSFAYAFNGPLDEVSSVPHLGEGIRHLRLMGYRSVVLIGHSAGGIVARHFVEDDPDAGVTKVIQVSTPNDGSPWAICQLVQPREADFLGSLTKPVRRLAVAGRSDREIPAHIECVCVVANGMVVGDGVVGTKSQWSDDLQQQGIPAYTIATTHWQTVRTKAGAELIAGLVRSSVPRWDSVRVAAMRHAILGESTKATPRP
jgi:pimeloyl-ACP methyl ester carboxylesterase